MTDQELDGILAALKSDGSVHLDSVAGRVMREIDAQRRRRRRGLWAGLAAAAAAGLIAIRLSNPQQVTRPAMVLSAPSAPQIGYTRQEQRRVRHRPAAHMNVTSPQKPGPLEVRLQTGDPDVLIIWLVDGEE